MVSRNIVPTIPNVCAKLSTSPNPNSTLSKRRISQPIIIKFSIYQIDARKLSYRMLKLISKLVGSSEI
jgi:hypothetical protein